MKKNGGGRMKINKNLYSVTFASVALILFLILFSSAASAASPMVTETRMTTNPSNSENPVIYGNTIAWQDDRNGNWDIYIQDLSTKQQIHTTNLASQLYPAIYDKKVVWEDYRNGNPNIYLQDLSTKKQTRIATGNAYQRNPAIYGNRIVWEDYRSGYQVVGNENGNPDIYMYDLSTKKETRISTSKSAHNPAIYGDKIVWDDWRNGYADIYMYDLSTKKETRITINGSSQSNPAIYGNRIVWHDDRNGGGIDIYMYDLSTKKESRITTNSPEAIFPAIYGNRIVWADIPNGVWHVYIYDLSTRQVTHTTGKSDQWDPAIYGDRIVWADIRNQYVDSNNQWHNSDIYMGTLSYSTVAAFSASPVSGKAPLTVKFTDKSTGSPAYWSWNFGDKSISTARNPTHKYTKAGKYTVSLTVKNAAGSNTATKSGYIIVK